MNNSFLSPELHLKNFNVFRTDRSNLNSNKTRGGGVLIAVDRTIMAREVPTQPNVEQLFVSITLGKQKFIVGACYLPPDAPTALYEAHAYSVESLFIENPESEFLLLGDYNLPAASWACCSELGQYPPSGDGKFNCIRNLCNLLNLKQKNCVTNVDNRSLDLVLSKVPNLAVCQSFDIFVECDTYHPPLSINVPLNNKFTNLKYSGTVYDFKKCDFDSICDYLQHQDWSFLHTISDLETIVNIFYKVLYTAIDTFVPKKKLYCSSYPVWFTKELIESIKNKKIAHRCYKNSNSDANYQEFSKLRSKCKTLSRECYLAYISEVEDNIHGNSKCFWNFVQSSRKSIGLPDNLFFNDDHSDDPQVIANLFAKYFSSVYEPETSTQPTTFHYGDPINLSSVTITADELCKQLESLNASKPSGPDQIPPSLLKNCYLPLSYPLLVIFNQSLSKGIFPTFWKTSYLIPIFKSGDQHDVTNYRPICIQSTIPKLFEKIILNQITNHLHNIITPYQHGFCTGRSTLTNILLFQDDIYKSFESSSQVDVIYTDFSKAFDKVSIPLLLSKLQAYGISGHLLDWFAGYLTHRKLSVKVRLNHSFSFNASSGVPQGSHLGPILFILFINDIAEIFDNVRFQLFADDLKVYKKITSVSDALILQSNLDSFYSWTKVNQLHLNISKCKSITYHRINSPILTDYTIGQEHLQRVNEIRDLGILFDSHLNFNSHISMITSKAFRNLGFLIRNSNSFKVSTVKILYCSLVRSVLEYLSPIWSPHYTLHVHSIERIQRKFLRYINYKLGILAENFDSNFILTTLNVSTLESRRTVGDCVALFKILNNKIDCPDLLEKINFRVPAANTRNNALFQTRYVPTNYLYYSPLSRLHRSGNSLIKNNIDIFNTKIEKIKNLQYTGLAKKRFF